MRTRTAKPGGSGKQEMGTLLKQAGRRTRGLVVLDVQDEPLLRTSTFQTEGGGVALRQFHALAQGPCDAENWALGHLAREGVAVKMLAASALEVLVEMPPQAVVDPASREHAARLGMLAGRLHNGTGLTLHLQKQHVREASFQHAYQRVVAALQAWLQRREADGLGQDLLAYSLVRLVQSLERHIPIWERECVPRPARVLCHGAWGMEAVRQQESGVWVLANFERAHVGDPARDLALLWENAGLEDAGAFQMIDAYTQVRRKQDARLLARVMAWRPLVHLERVMEQLLELQACVDSVTLVDALELAAIHGFTAGARESIRDAINALRPYTGPARPTSLAEVEGMGPLLAMEELHCRGRQMVVGVEGAPFSGKSAVAQELAQRLGVPWLDVDAVVQAAMGKAGALRSSPARVAAQLGRLKTVAQGGRVVVQQGRAAAEARSIVDEDARAMQQEPLVREALKSMVARWAAGGVVVEASHVQELLPAGALAVELWESLEGRMARHAAKQGAVTRQDADWERDDDTPRTHQGGRVMPLEAARTPVLVRQVLRVLAPQDGAQLPSLGGRPVLFA